jgi:hypothetical protein
MTAQQLTDCIANLRATLKRNYPLVYADCYQAMSDEAFWVDIQDKLRARQRYMGQPIMITRTFNNGDIESLGVMTVQNQAQN